jgi:hypothetical protein
MRAAHCHLARQDARALYQPPQWPEALLSCTGISAGVAFPLLSQRHLPGLIQKSMLATRIHEREHRCQISIFKNLLQCRCHGKRRNSVKTLQASRSRLQSFLSPPNDDIIKMTRQKWSLMASDAIPWISEHKIRKS